MIVHPIGTVIERKLLDRYEAVIDPATGEITTPVTRAEWQLQVIDDENNTAWKPAIVIDETDEVIEEPAFMPLPGSQDAFLSVPYFEALYHGTRGNGKTELLLWDFAKDVGKGYGRSWRGILFRKTYGDLDDIAKKIEIRFPKIFPGFRFLRSKSEYQAIWKDGEALLLRAMDSENDYPEYHGHEYPWIGWEELTHWENDKAYKLMFSCCRSAVPGLRCRVRATTNPSGVGHLWLKKRFRLPHGTNKVIRIPDEMPRIAIQGDIRENFLLLHTSPDYMKIIKQAATSPAQMRAWLFGDWNVSTGGMIDDLWDPKIHILPSFPMKLVPHGWTITRAYDHGQSHPFAVQWWLESNGESIKLNGQEYGKIRGDLILFSEWYGCQEGEQNTGLRLSARRIAQGILDREDDFGMRGRVLAGPADTEIWSKDSRGTGRAPIDDMNDVGVFFEKADKTPGSRIRGWQMMRTLLEDAKPNSDGTRERPGLFVCERNRKWIELVPPVPRDPNNQDDIPAKYEDHQCDCTRYRLNWELNHMWRRNF